MTYHLCAEDMTKTAIVPNLSEEDRDALVNHGILPRESSAKDRFCVMCPVAAIRHISEESDQTHLGRVCPCHIQILKAPIS